MVGFCFVVLPLPYTVRKRVFTFFSESFIIAKLAYGLKIAFMCVLLSLTHLGTGRPDVYFSCRQIRWGSVCGRAQSHVPHHSRGGGRKIWKRRHDPWCTCWIQLRRSEVLVRSCLMSFNQTNLYWQPWTSAQRNTYLTGFALFLSLCLTRTFYIVLELIHVQDEYAKLKKEVRLILSP